MIYLELFYVFFLIGAFTFGGGYAMIPLIKSEVVSRGWMTEDAIIDFIAVSESTPGPFAINIATFIGSQQAGFLGSILATLGVILPSFIVILIVAAVFTAISKNRFVKAIMHGIRPVTIGLIAAAAISIILEIAWSGFPNGVSISSINYVGLIMIALVAGIYIVYKKVLGKPMHPILLISISAVLGIVVYGWIV